MLERLVSIGEGINKVVGVVTSWLMLLLVITCFATVYTRYALNTNFTWLQDSYLWMHAAAIVLGAGYTMLMGGFVRVDIFYGKWSPQRRARADLIQTIIFLFPFVLVCGWAFWVLFSNSYMADESSPNPGGLPNFWALKITLIAFTVLVLLQGAAIVARCLLVLQGREEFVLKSGSH